MAAIEACRTAALGGHVEQCEDCGAIRVAYNSCRDRHCPKCQGLARLQWLADRRAELLPAPYFHIVFTTPAPVAALALQNKAIVYDILFKAAAETIRRIGADPRHLGAETGMIAILHTWGQALTHHPHVHCIAPGGGLGQDGQWIASRSGFFLPVRVLSRLYRRLFLERLQAAFDAADLQFFGDLAPLAEPTAFAAYLAAQRRVKWVVYAKRPFGGPRQVLDYLGRYTHRVAIANGRLLDCVHGREADQMAGVLDPLPIEPGVHPFDERADAPFALVRNGRQPSAVEQDLFVLRSNPKGPLAPRFEPGGERVARLSAGRTIVSAANPRR